MYTLIEEFEDTKGIIKIRKSKEVQTTEKKTKQRSTEHYIEN
jgi:hypothetical protein